MHLENSYFVEGHYRIELQDSYSQVEELKVKMNGNMAFIYDSVLSIITDYIKSNFNIILGNLLVN